MCQCQKPCNMTGNANSNQIWRKQKQFVEQTVNSRLNNHSAWPRQMFRLELESAGLYQDRTSKILNELRDDGVIGKRSLEVGNNDISFMTRPNESNPKPDDDVKNATRKVNEFFEASSDFSELAAYTALCRVCDELRDNISFDVLPTNNYPHILGGLRKQVDVLLLLEREKVPVEVYNGSDFLSKKKDGHHSKKYKQMRDRYQEENPMCRPMLINRRADSDMIDTVRSKFDSVVINTDVIVGCEDTHGDMQQYIDILNLSEIIKLIPRLETEEGTKLNGSEFENAASSNERAAEIQPESKLAGAASSLPKEYLKRVRGGLQLHYVNTFYRRTNDTTESNASMVLQEIYNLLLRKGGVNKQRAMDEGWDRFEADYRNKADLVQFEDEIMEKVNEYINELKNKRIIEYGSNGKIYARNATHPQPSFSF